MIALDTETTGLLRPSATDIHLQPFIIEICALKLDDDFNIIGEINTLVKPPIPIDEEITKITKITNEMVKDSPSFVEIYDRVVNFFLGERVVFAHNCAFDMNVLLYELKRMGNEFRFPWPPRQICTVEASFAIQNKRLRLQQLYSIATGKDSFPNAHRAKADVLAMIECIKFLAENDFI